jgi:hypothetical protein
VRGPHHIDLEAIAERYGAELSVAEFINRSVCSECGARWPNISITLESLLASLGDCAGAAGKKGGSHDRAGD